MDPTFDGLTDFSQWYAQLPPAEIDSILGQFPAVVDVAIALAGAQSTFHAMG
jgi:hypothetical protein